MAHADRGWTTYTNNDGVGLSLKCLAHVAAQNGSGFSQAPPLPGLYWPGHRSDLRAVYAVEDGGCKTMTMIAMAEDSPIYALGVTIQDVYGNDYIVTGLRAEKIRLRNMK